MGPIRVIFLSYASDPIVTFDVSVFWKAPDGLVENRPVYIVHAMRGYPWQPPFSCAATRPFRAISKDLGISTAAVTTVSGRRQMSPRSVNLRSS
ncbi:MAG: alpha/beta-hydrolase family protein [Dinoroseobacter sp.]|nr:alpha/beta-hydrolase family protein [Dinoroseobacter sp.]